MFITYPFILKRGFALFFGLVWVEGIGYLIIVF